MLSTITDGFNAVFNKNENLLEVSHDDWSSDGSLVGGAADKFITGNYDNVLDDGQVIDMTITDNGQVFATDDI